MGTPYRIAQSPVRFDSCDKSSAEFQALSLISKSLSHPQRTILSTFVQDAVNRELASRFFLDQILIRSNSTVAECLEDWVNIVRDVRPTLCEDMDESVKESIFLRDGSRCCISSPSESKRYKEEPLVINILSPTLFDGGNVARSGRLHAILSAFLGETQLEYLSSRLCRDFRVPGSDISDQLMLLSPRTFNISGIGRLFLKGCSSADASVEYMVQQNRFISPCYSRTTYYVTCEHRAVDASSLPDAHLISIHRQFAPALAWLEVSEYMTQANNAFPDSKLHKWGEYCSKMSPIPKWAQSWMQPLSSSFRYLWIRTPTFFRGFVYRHLALLGQRLYGYTGSDRIFRLPFNYYMRVASRDWAPKHQAELEALRLVEKFTQIPAPRGVDTVQYSGSSFLLMTGLPGEGIGERLPTMTDKQVDIVAHDLQDYIAQLRRIPNKTGSEFQICNPLGVGIQDWRIGDSQRNDLKFHDEAEFHQYLTHDLPLDESAQKKISIAHSVKHDIVFTHADLNLRNILVDENGRISGIVDWECAGWYPEYWEFTKMHFTVRFTTRWLADVVNQIFQDYHDVLEVEDLLVSMKPSW